MDRFYLGFYNYNKKFDSNKLQKRFSKLQVLFVSTYIQKMIVICSYATFQEKKAQECHQETQEQPQTKQETQLQASRDVRWQLCNYVVG